MSVTSLGWLLPLASSSLSLLFAALVARQWMARRKPYQAVWAAGLVWYAVASGTEVLGNAFGWTEGLYRAWYLFGAIMVAAYLGAGEVYLLRESRFGYLAAAGVLLGATPSLGRAVADLRTDPATAQVALGVGLAGVLAAALIAITQRLRRQLVGHVTLACLVAGTLASAVAVGTAPVDTTRLLDPNTGVVHGRGFPDTVRLVTPLFNIAGAATLVLGAAYSGWQFWRRGLYPHRAASNALIALGGFIPSITSSLSRFGLTGGFYLGELLGVVCIFIGFLVSTEVFVHRMPAGEAAAPQAAAA